MADQIKQRCIYCGGDIYYQGSEQLVKCELCGHTLIVAKFENEIARMKKIEEENALVSQQLEEAEKEKQAADNRLFAALSGMESLENTQDDILNLLKVMKGDSEEQTHVLGDVFHTLMSGQKDADRQLQLLQGLSDRILKSQDDMLMKVQTQSEVVGQLFAIEMDVQKRQKLANDFMLWMQNIQSEDTEKLQQIKSASGLLLEGQKKIGDKVDKLRHEAESIKQSIKGFEEKWQGVRLQEIQQLYHQAWSLQSDRIFDKAGDYYRQVQVKGGEDPDVYWRLIMCHYCLTYQRDDEGNLIPIILNPDLTDPAEMSIRRDLIQHTSGREEHYYQEELAKIDRILDRYRLVRNQMKFDVFISVKQKKDGRQTSDSDKASDLYDFLSGKGLKVFNSRRSELPAGREYEPYIIAALMSARALIVVGSSAENMNAQWVRNEWSRFQWLQKKEIEKTGKTDRLLLCYLTQGMQPDQIPRALNPSQQAICEDVNASYRLLSALNPLLGGKEPENPQGKIKEASLEEVLDEMTVCLLTGDYAAVTGRYTKIKTAKPYMYAPQLHLYALCAMHHAEDAEQLAEMDIDLRKEGLFKLALKFSKGKPFADELQRLLEVNRGRKKTDPDARKEEPVPVPAEEIKDSEIRKETRQPVTAEDWYEKGKKDILADNRTDAFTDFQKAAEAGHPMAMVDLGFMYYSAFGVPFNEVEADKWIKKGINTDSPLLKSDFDWYVKAAENGCTQIQAQLGYMYEMRIGVKPERDEKKYWYKKAAEQGHAYAQIRMGYCMRTGRPEDIDAEEAFQWFMKAAQQGHPQGQFEVACCYRNGRGVGKDESEVYKWHKKAADQGYGPALTNLGSCYENGRGVKTDFVMAAKYYRMAAEKGRVQAFLNLGRFYEKGLGVTRDLREAARMYEQAVKNSNRGSLQLFAAEANYARVTQSAQKCYEKGMQLKGESKGNAYETVAWIRAAAEGDHLAACEELAGIYEKGFSQGVWMVSSQPEEAEKWRKRAEELKKASATEKASNKSKKTSSDVSELVKETALAITPDTPMLVMEQPGNEDKDTFVEVYPAMRIDRGFLKETYSKDQRTEIILQNPYVLLTNEQMDSVVKVFDLYARFPSKIRSSLIVAKDIDELSVGVFSGPESTFSCAMVKAPGYGDRGIEMLRDLAVFTNGTAIITNDGMSVKNITHEMLGTATTVIAREEETIIINTQPDTALVSKRINTIKAERDKSTSDYDKEKLTERIYNLQGRAAVFWVSGPTDTEKKARRKELEVYIEKLRGKSSKPALQAEPVTQPVQSEESLYNQGLKLVNEQNYSGALPLLKQAAEKGHAEAQYQLGNLYYMGNGTVKSAEEAVKWYRKAAEAGNKDSQWRLGYCYQFGDGVHKSLEEAKRWYQKAADQGGAAAKDALKRIEAQLQSKKTCPICGYVSESGKLMECPICGSDMK